MAFAVPWNRKPENAPGMKKTGVGGETYNAAQRALAEKADSEKRALNAPGSAFNQSYAKREGQLKEQYANARMAMESQKGALGSEYNRQIARQSAISGGPGGGASLKIARKGQQDLAQTYGGLEAGMASEEAAARSNLEAQKSSERLAREGMIDQSAQFDRTMQFQEASFADQMRYSWNEFDENQKTNLLNAAALLKDAGLNSGKLQEYIRSMRYFYGSERAPGWST